MACNGLKKGSFHLFRHPKWCRIIFHGSMVQSPTPYPRPHPPAVHGQTCQKKTFVVGIKKYVSTHILF